MQHPHGVQPWGNYLLNGGKEVRSAGLGRLRILSDELILAVLAQLPANSLVSCSATSKALYCFCNHEELWRALTLQEFEGRFKYQTSWQHTYLAAARLVEPKKQHTHAPLRVQGFYSDLLYQPWFCATTPIRDEWLQRDNLERRSNLSIADFRQQFELPNRPVVLSDAAKSWPARKKWTRKYLRKAFKGHKVVAGNYPMDFDDFVAYSDAATDDMPLYLFDCKFAAKAPKLAADYEVPEHFREDLFAVLGESARPDHRWLIMGPQRSGSSFHKDPNATSAWNAVVRGSKKWILFPPHIQPPGVHASVDGADVATPVSIVEWFLNFYEAAQHGRVRPLEGIVRAGEVLFVPRGWWHLAINLEETIAVTHNYVSSAGLPVVLAFLKTGRVDLVSGCAEDERANLHDRFVAALRQQRPQVLDACLEEERSKSKMRSLASLFHGTTDAPLQHVCKRHKADSKGPDAANKVTGSPAVFKFNFADG
ncbi:Bifunctional arginine demethylase and lysyl-hydroxylase JM [Coccomyxa sp. Obi]|nr:Bifunctional arginine demethylase and lysyl-hydroxylase JM [Coccomyxa sp. Obi]